MNFGVLPPEINAGRMYAGPGSGPLMAAAAAWDEIAAALATAASGYGLVIAELTAGPWVGSASSSMVSAVLPYVGWLGAVAGSAEETASQGRAAAAAFETAFAMTVPPPAIAANRVLLATLIATNFFGQNTPAIMATEAQYAEMWAQDAAAMYGYAAASATASELAPFASPPNTSTPDGVTGQALALTQALQQPAGNSAQTAASTIFQLTAATATTSSQPGPFTWLTNAIRDFLQYAPPAPANNYLGLAPSMYTAVLKQTTGLAYFSNGLSNFGMSIAQQLTTGPGGATVGATVGAGGAWFPTPQFAQLGLGNLGNVGTASSVMAGAGQAAHVGALSVPQQWATLTSGVSPDNAVEGEAIPVRAAGAMTNAPGNALLGGMPTGGSVRRTASVGYSHKYGFRYSVLTRPPSAG